MKRILVVLLGMLIAGGWTIAAQATPDDDLKDFRNFFFKRFPGIPLEEYANGVYALDSGSRAQWESFEEFPQYELDIDAGEKLFNTAFKNGKGYADCFPNGGIGIRDGYPYFDGKKVKTLELEINECRESNGEKPLKYKKGKMAQLSAYMSFTTRGKMTNVKVEGAGALAAYNDGKRFFYAKRGQLNFSCANCHVDSAGMKVRADMLSPALGQTTHFPVYRNKWGGLGTMHRRYGGCNKQVRAKPFKAQSVQYRNLELFHTYMSNGIEMNGPGTRK